MTVPFRGQLVDLAGPATVVVRVDAARAVQILVNLIDNAAKYSPEGSAVAVAWGVAEGTAVIKVRDQGPGIPASGQRRLFTRFGRVPGSPMRAGRIGTGLGLYLSRHVAQVMGGSLHLEETGVGGSTFRLTLPLADEDPLVS